MFTLSYSCGGAGILPNRAADPLRGDAGDRLHLPFPGSGFPLIALSHLLTEDERMEPGLSRYKIAHARCSITFIAGEPP